MATETGPAQEEAPLLLIRYRHDDCEVRPGITWTSKWSCACDDECPACGVDIEASDWEELT